MSELALRSTRVTLAILNEDEAELVLQFMLENREHLAPWEPERTDDAYRIETIRARVRDSDEAFVKGTAYPYAILDNDTGRMIGTCNFSNVVRGVFQACHLGFSIAKSHEGRGIMYETLQVGIAYMFDTVGLHRIMANYLPHNERSARLLKRLGFEHEGYAKSYLKIAGQWQDHVLMALVNPKER